MATFVASKFNPETDPDRPKVGTEVDYDGKRWVIMQVAGHFLMSDLLKPDFDEPPNPGFDKWLAKDHATRPAVFWSVWLNEVKPGAQNQEDPARTPGTSDPGN